MAKLSSEKWPRTDGVYLEVDGKTVSWNVVNGRGIPDLIRLKAAGKKATVVVGYLKLDYGEKRVNLTGYEVWENEFNRLGHLKSIGRDNIGKECAIIWDE